MLCAKTLCVTLLDNINNIICLYLYTIALLDLAIYLDIEATHSVPLHSILQDFEYSP